MVRKEKERTESEDSERRGEDNGDRRKRTDSKDYDMQKTK
jgi:hypothetical protein